MDGFLSAGVAGSREGLAHSRSNDLFTDTPAATSATARHREPVEATVWSTI
jgi:hypothetical protein